MGHKPTGFHTITPNIVTEQGDALIEFLQKAFGAEVRMRLTMPGGKLAHCELQIGDSRINIGESMEGWPPHPLLAQVFVEDSDAAFKRVLAAGAKELSPVTDMFFGTREGRAIDPFGNTWTVSTMKEELSGEEMQRRIDKMAG